MGDRRLRSAVRKQRERARFWTEHGEKIRLALIGAAMVMLAAGIAKAALQ